MAQTLRFLAIVLSACATLSVQTDFDPSASFSDYQSFSWLAGLPEKTGDIRVDNPLIHTRVRDAVEEELASKGYEKLSVGTPDFYIGYHLSLETKLDVRTVDAHYGYGPRGRMGVPERRYYQYEEGTLVLDVVDVKLGSLVWRGSGQRRIQEDSPTPEESRRRIHEAVAEILQRFPPQ